MTTHRLERGWPQLVARHRLIVVIASLVLLALVAPQARHIQPAGDYRVYFSEDNPERLDFEQVENTFARNDTLVIVVEPAGGVFTAEGLELVADLTEGAWQLPYSTRVDSLTNFQHTFAQGDDLVVEDLVDPERGDLEPGSREAAIARAREVALSDPRLVSRLVDPKGELAAVAVTIQRPRKNESVETEEAVTATRALIERFRREAPDAGFYLTGTVAMDFAFREASETDSAGLIPLSFAVMMVLLWLILKSRSAAALTLGTVLLSVLCGMGVAGLLEYRFNAPLVIAPVVILTVAIANSVHILINFLHAFRAGAGRVDAVCESLRINLQPVTVASLTTAVGFLSMNASEVPPFRDLGNATAAGVVFSWVFSLTFLPAMLMLLPLKPGATGEDDERLVRRLGAFVVRQRTKLLVIGAVGIVGLIALIPRNEIDDTFLYYFDERIGFRTDTDYINERLTGMYSVDFALYSSGPEDIASPAYLEEVAAFVEYLRGHERVKHVASVTDTLKRLNQNLHGDDPAWYRMPEGRELAAQYLLLYEMSLPYGLDLTNQINVDRSALRISAFMGTMSGNDLIDISEAAQKWLDENAPHVTRVIAASPTLMFAKISRRNTTAMVGGIVFAMILISGILMVAVRSVKYGLIALAPNLFPAAAAFGVWSLVHGEVGLALSVVTSMTIGIVVDDTVHLMTKYLRARRERGLDAFEAVRYSFRTVGRALLVTSLVLVLGFALLAYSSFYLNSAMGIMTGIIITLALVIDFFLLPPFLMLIEGGQETDVVETTAADLPAPTRD